MPIFFWQKSVWCRAPQKPPWRRCQSVRIDMTNRFAMHFSARWVLNLSFSANKKSNPVGLLFLLAELVCLSESNREKPQEGRRCKRYEWAFEGAEHAWAIADERRSREVEFVNLSFSARKKHTFVYQDNVCFFQRNLPVRASEIATLWNIRWRECGQISFHIDQREIFYNFRRKLFHIRRAPDISLEKTLDLCYNNSNIK